MFLGRLSEKEKNAFLSLSVHASNSNDVFAEEEKMMIREYCKEMEIPFFDIEKTIPLDKVVELFKESELSVKKIVLLEILGLLYSDGVVDDSEKKFVNEYAKKIGLTKEDVEKQTAAIKEYIHVLKKVAEVIL